MRDRSLVRHESTYAAAPGPRTVAVPRCETSNSPTAVRTAVCSASTPPPAYSIGIDQPLKSASLAPAATCRSWRGEVRGLTGGHANDPRCRGPRRADEARGAAESLYYDRRRAADDHHHPPPAREALRRRRRRRRRQGPGG